MKRMMVRVALIVPLVLLYIVGMLLLFDYEDRQSSKIHEKIFAIIASPDDQTIATVFDYDMGATTGFRTFVSLQKTNALLSFDCEDILIMHGRPKVTVKWLDDNTIIIFYEAEAEVTYHAATWRDIKIRFTAK